MPDLVDAAAAILAQAQQRTEIAGRNIANATTPAYKRQIAFSSILSGDGLGQSAASALVTATDFTVGKVVLTGNPFDLAVLGPGFLVVRQGDTSRLVRAGRFTRAEDGKLVDSFGGVLQAANGSDAIARGDDFVVRPDGRILLAGADAGRLAVHIAEEGKSPRRIEGGYAEAGTRPADPAEFSLRQGAYEASNVTTGNEMVEMMAALRMAESGQRVMITYDDLMGRVISSFGDSLR